MYRLLSCKWKLRAEASRKLLGSCSEAARKLLAGSLAVKNQPLTNYNSLLLQHSTTLGSSMQLRQSGGMNAGWHKAEQ
jgi:hypothetical protein